MNEMESVSIWLVFNLHFTSLGNFPSVRILRGMRKNLKEDEGMNKSKEEKLRI